MEVLAVEASATVRPASGALPTPACRSLSTAAATPAALYEDQSGAIRLNSPVDSGQITVR